MHPFFFGIKRVHLRVVEIEKALLRDHDLTPARFDVLRTVKARDEDIPQQSLVELFGVSRVTISRMLKALEKQRFIRRYREAHDQRFKRVVITKKGKEALDRFKDTVVMAEIAASIVTSDRHVSSYLYSVQKRVDRMTDILVRGRRFLLDKSEVRYPWPEWRIEYRELPKVALYHDSETPLEKERYHPGGDRKPAPDDLADWEIQLLRPMKEFRARYAALLEKGRRSQR